MRTHSSDRPAGDRRTPVEIAADALHAATVIAFDAEFLVSADDAILDLDGVLANTGGRKIICRDTDLALQFL